MQTLRQSFLQHNAQTTDNPLLLEFTKSQGLYLYDAVGRAYIDMIAGIGVSNIGHNHPNVVKAVQEQAENYMHLMVYGEFVQKPQVKYAETLSQHLPDGLDCVYFTNSGAEAVEGALKLAKRITGCSEIIACHNSYHGSTHGALSVMGNEDYKYAFRPLLPGIRFITFNQQADLEKISEQTACIILETVQGEAGIRVPDREYMQQLRKRCTETGTLLILDEIQTGCGRTGKLWAFEHFDIVPDILLSAKALGGGMPLGAFITSKENMWALTNQPILGHITTFGGHPVSCAAGLAAFNLLVKDKIYSDVERKHQLFKKLLIHPAIRAFRGKGLLMALEFDSFGQNKAIIDACIANGLITDWFLHDSKSMRLAPPLIITDEQIIEACEIIVRSIEEEGF